MSWQIARRLTADSDKHGDGFFEARKAWLQQPDTARRDACLSAAIAYRDALTKEIEHLQSMGDHEDAIVALKRARMYQRLLIRQLKRIEGSSVDQAL